MKIQCPKCKNLLLRELEVIVGKIKCKCPECEFEDVEEIDND